MRMNRVDNNGQNCAGMIMKPISHFSGSRKRSSTCLLSSLLLPGMIVMGISLPGTAAMVELGGDYTYRGTITMTGEALIGPAIDVRNYPQMFFNFLCPVQ